MSTQQLQNKVNNLEKKVKELTQMLESVEAKKKDAEFEVQERDDVIKKLEARVEEIANLIEEQFLTEVKEFKLGEKDTSIKMDQQGLWVGKDKYSEATTGTPVPSTAIAMDGDFYPKGGVTGSFDADGGSPTVTVTRGIITDIS